jgi:hypothetical protein
VKKWKSDCFGGMIDHHLDDITRLNSLNKTSVPERYAARDGSGGKKRSGSEELNFKIQENGHALEVLECGGLNWLIRCSVAVV